jgi:hypothetical protein
MEGHLTRYFSLPSRIACFFSSSHTIHPIPNYTSDDFTIPTTFHQTTKQPHLSPCLPHTRARTLSPSPSRPSATSTPREPSSRIAWMTLPAALPALLTPVRPSHVLSTCHSSTDLSLLSPRVRRRPVRREEVPRRRSEDRWPGRL